LERKIKAEVSFPRANLCSYTKISFCHLPLKMVRVDKYSNLETMARVKRYIPKIPQQTMWIAIPERV